MIDIKWKCRKCGHVNRWNWQYYDPIFTANWYCDGCDQSEHFKMVETRPGKWRRVKKAKFDSSSAQHPPAVLAEIEQHLANIKGADANREFLGGSQWSKADVDGFTANRHGGLPDWLAKKTANLVREYGDGLVHGGHMYKMVLEIMDWHQSQRGGKE